MAIKTTTSKTAGFEITLVNADNTDTTKRTVSFDLPSNSTITAENLATIASTYFAVGGMSDVFQPTNWRDYEGAYEVYTMQSVQPILTTKTVAEADEITPA